MEPSVVESGSITIEESIGKTLIETDYDQFQTYKLSFNRHLPFFCCCKRPIVLKGEWGAIENAKKYIERTFDSQSIVRNADSTACLLENPADNYQSISRPISSRTRATTGGEEPHLTIQVVALCRITIEQSIGKLLIDGDYEQFKTLNLSFNRWNDDCCMSNMCEGHKPVILEGTYDDVQKAIEYLKQTYTLITEEGNEDLDQNAEQPNSCPPRRMRTLQRASTEVVGASVTTQPCAVTSYSDYLSPPAHHYEGQATDNTKMPQADQHYREKSRVPGCDKAVTESSIANSDGANTNAGTTFLLPQPPASTKKEMLPADQPPHSPANATQNIPFSSTSRMGGTYRYGNGQLIHVFTGDLTKLLVGAVVNASNVRLLHGGGMAGAIKKAAGPGLQEECTRHVKKYGELDTSQVYVSAAYNIPCQYIIHVAGPKWKDFKDKTRVKTLLYHSFLNCLQEAERLRQPSIAIPAVGAGIYGSPLTEVANQMYGAVKSFLDAIPGNSHVRDILLVDISSDIVNLINDIMVKEESLGNLTILEPSFQQFISNNVPENTNSSESHKITVLSTVSSPNGDHEVKPKECEENAAFEMGEETSDDDCAICMDKATEKVVLSQCGHIFCKECIERWFKDKPTCPNCGQIYGAMRGDQPDGNMYVRRISENIPGYDDTEGAIMITYRFPPGYQQDCHPNPGRQYSGTTRVGYLPDNEEGQLVLSLLRRAFDSRLIFTIGRSTTTGRDGRITWNDIHHKTSVTGGPQRFGYPDSTYLSRVKEELAAKGIK